MTYRIGGIVFFELVTTVRAGLCVAAISVLSACTTSSIDDLAPNSGAAFPPAPAAPVDPAANALESAAIGGPLEDEIAERNTSGTAADTGQYPNLNIAPGSAAPIPTEAEVAAKKAALRERQQAVASTVPGKPPYDSAKLKKLASTHAEEALKEIEGE